MAGITRGHWWSWYEPPEPDKPLPEWLLDIAGGDDPTSVARPWFMLKTDRDLKQWPDQRWVKNEAVYHSHSGDGRMVQYQAGSPDLNFSTDHDAWVARGPAGNNPPAISLVRLVMVEPLRFSFLGGALTLTGSKWRTENEPISSTFDGDFRGKDVVINGADFGEEPMGYSRVGYVGMGGSAYAGCRSLPPGIAWWNMPSTPNLGLEHSLIARAVAKLQPTIRCAIVSSSFGTRLEPVERQRGLPKGMRADQEIPVIAKPESPPPSEDSAASFLA
jgi:hypothetical protein